MSSKRGKLWNGVYYFYVAKLVAPRVVVDREVESVTIVLYYIGLGSSLTSL